MHLWHINRNPLSVPLCATNCKKIIIKHAFYILEKLRIRKGITQKRKQICEL